MSTKKTPYKVELDSLRGVAAFLIVCLHFTTYLFPSLGEVVLNYTPALKRTYLFVDLFFVLSGYVLALNYAQAFQQSISISSYFVFMKKRFLKLYPLHLFTLSLLVLLYWGLDTLALKSHFINIVNPSAMVLNLTLFQSAGIFDQGCYDCTSWNYPAWSISVEWIIYFILPISFFMISKLKRLVFIPLILLLCSLYYFVDLKFGHLDYASYPALLRCAFGALLGASMYILTKEEKQFKATLVSCVIIAILISLHFLSIDTLIVLMMSLLVYVTTGIERDSWLTNKKLIWLGKRSFSLYMIHAVVHLYLDYIVRLVFNIQMKDISITFQLIGFLFLIPVTLTLANITYILFEQKLHTKLRLLFKA